jgi:putative tricarboxylic transport membrane protein
MPFWSRTGEEIVDKRDIASGVVLLFISILILLASLRLGLGPYRSPGPGFIPFWASLLLAFLSCLLLGRRLLRPKAAVSLGELWKDRSWAFTVIVVSVLIVYGIVLPKLGYLLATFGLMLVLFSLGKMKTWAVIPSSVLAVLLTYGLFDSLLKMPLPRGILGF